jgi:enoyl-CoA hydratase
LNRPQALNALTYPMCLAIGEALERWRVDPGVALVLIDAAGDKAFCAGGDIATIHAQITAGAWERARSFWRDEYRLNAAIAEYPKPVVALMQGFVMGGGVGLGCHSAQRVVGESSRIAMPECGIGLIPDVGGSFLLTRARGELGTWLGLTGTRMGPGDAIHARFADCFVPEARWPELVAALVATGDPARVESFAEPEPQAAIAALEPWTGRIFARDTVAAIIGALEADASVRAAEALKAMRRASPLALCATLDCLRRVRGGTVRDALRQEFRFTWRAPDRSDLAEGIRALIIDKDRTPRWRHASVEAVPADAVTGMLAPLGAEELDFGEEGQ